MQRVGPSAQVYATHTVAGGVDPCSRNWPVKAALSASRRLRT